MSTDVNVPGKTAAEREIDREQLKLLREQRAETEAFKPLLYQGMGLKEDPATGKLVRMTEKERLATMSPLERSQYELATGYAERQKKALAGEITSPALEKRLTEEEARMTEQLARDLGPNWRNTTAGVQRMDAFRQRADLMREEVARGALTTGEALLSSSTGYLSNEAQRGIGNFANTPGRTTGVLANYGNVGRGYRADRNLLFQANAQSAANRAGIIGSAFGAAGTGLGLAYGGG